MIIPPLRNRKEDIAELVNYYLARISRRTGTEPRICQPEFMRCLYEYEWPGNVRELVHVLDMVAATAGREPVLFHKHLPVEIRLAVINQQIKAGGVNAGKQAGLERMPLDGEDLATWQDFRKAALHNLEREYLLRLLDQTQGDVTRMTAMAGMGKSRIYELLEKHGLSSKKTAAKS
jgi:two-component system NtrC family response regulator